MSLSIKRVTVIAGIACALGAAAPLANAAASAPVPLSLLTGQAPPANTCGSNQGQTSGTPNLGPLGPSGPLGPNGPFGPGNPCGSSGTDLGPNGPLGPNGALGPAAFYGGLFGGGLFGGGLVGLP